MRTIVVTSAKGGVGKTTVALHLAHALASQGHRTLLVDTDPQGAIGLSINADIMKRPGFVQAVGKSTLAELVLHTKAGGLSILPFGQLRAIDIDAFVNEMRDGQRFAKLYSECESDYDVVVVDTPAGVHGLSAGAMRAGGHVLLPVQAEPIALRAIPRLLEMVRALRQEGADLKMLGICLTMLDLSHETSAQVAQELTELFPARLLFQSHIPRDPAFAKAAGAGVPVGFLRNPPPPVTYIFDALAAEVVDKLKLTKGAGHAPQPFLD